MTTTSLSRIHPDYQQIKAQLLLQAQASSTLSNLVATDMGALMIDAIAATGDYSQFSIQSAFVEAFPRTARLDSSIYESMISNGVRLSRKQPASISVTLTRTTTTTILTIPEYSAFSIGNMSVFNRSSLTFAVGQASISATLYEGIVFRKNFVGSGLPYQEIATEESKFIISDVDVRVTVNDIAIPVVSNPIYKNPATSAVQDLTTRDGQLLLRFGTSSVGTVPSINSNVVILYVNTRGALANDSTLLGKKVAFSTDSTVTGVTTTGMVNGVDEKSPQYYKSAGPVLANSEDRGVTQVEHSAIAATYPGVIDALVVGQRQIAPTNNAYMNLAKITLLTATPFTQAEKDEFLRWYKQRATFPTEFYFENPTPIAADITANIYFKKSVDLATGKAEALSVLSNLFVPRLGFLNGALYLHDIHRSVTIGVSGIDFMTLVTPTDNITSGLSPSSAPVLTALPGAGTLAAGTYTYGISVVNSTLSGQTLISQRSQVTVTAGSAVRIDIPKITAAGSIQIFGRGPSLNLIAAVSPTTASYTDNGSVAPTTAEPTIETGGVRYLIAGTITVNAFYSTR